jgi:hypothetical protein
MAFHPQKNGILFFSVHFITLQITNTSTKLSQAAMSVLAVACYRADVVADWRLTHKSVSVSTADCWCGTREIEGEVYVVSVQNMLATSLLV